jgi:hypothetical protein
MPQISYFVKVRVVFLKGHCSIWHICSEFVVCYFFHLALLDIKEASDFVISRKNFRSL